MARHIPTWFTGALVAKRMARSATERPWNSHTSPLRAREAASSRDILWAAGMRVRYGDALVEVAGARRTARCRRRGSGRRAEAPGPHLDGVPTRGAALAP